MADRLREDVGNLLPRELAGFPDQGAIGEQPDLAAGRFGQAELTRAADKLYRHQAQFINPQAVPIWRLSHSASTFS